MRTFAISKVKDFIGLYEAESLTEAVMKSLLDKFPNAAFRCSFEDDKLHIGYEFWDGYIGEDLGEDEFEQELHEMSCFIREIREVFLCSKEVDDDEIVVCDPQGIFHLILPTGEGLPQDEMIRKYSVYGSTLIRGALV